MDDRDELRQLWQSQPLDAGAGISAPTFALLDDLTVPMYEPLSPWRRVGHLIGFAWMATFYWRHGWEEGWLQRVAAWAAVIIGVVGVFLVLRQRDRSRTPQPEESVNSYRGALADEFERQFRAERRILLLLWGGWLAVGAVWSYGHISAQGFDWGEIAFLVILFLFLAWAAAMYARTAAAVRSRLRVEAEQG